MEEIKIVGTVQRTRVKAEPVWSRTETGLRENRNKQKRGARARTVERLLVDCWHFSPCRESQSNRLVIKLDRNVL